MKKYLLVCVVCFLCSCAHDEMIEVTYMNHKKDTMMVNIQRLEINGKTLFGIRNTYSGGNYEVATNVKYYRMIKQNPQPHDTNQ